VCSLAGSWLSFPPILFRLNSPVTRRGRLPGRSLVVYSPVFILSRGLFDAAPRVGITFDH